jgi:3-oxoadipate enol-lactonase
VARYRHRLVTTDAVGYVGCCHAVGTVDTSARLGAIRVPCLVIAGELDQGTPVAMAQTLVDGLADARLEIIAEASHVSAVEQPVVFAELVSGFIGEL